MDDLTPSLRRYAPFLFWLSVMGFVLLSVYAFMAHSNGVGLAGSTRNPCAAWLFGGILWAVAGASLLLFLLAGYISKNKDRLPSLPPNVLIVIGVADFVMFGASAGIAKSCITLCALGSAEVFPYTLVATSVTIGLLVPGIAFARLSWLKGNAGLAAFGICAACLLVAWASFIRILLTGCLFG